MLICTNNIFFKLSNVYITLSHYEVNIRYLMVKFSRLNQRQPHIQASDINIKNGGWYIEQIKMQREKVNIPQRKRENEENDLPVDYQKGAVDECNR